MKPSDFGTQPAKDRKGRPTDLPRPARERRLYDRLPALHDYADPKELAEYQKAKTDDTPEGWAHYYRNDPVAQEHFAEHYRIRLNDLGLFERYVNAVPLEIQHKIRQHHVIYENGIPTWVPMGWIP
jgi:hypothetical protein